MMVLLSAAGDACATVPQANAFLPPLPSSDSDLTLAAIANETGTWSSNPLLATSGAKPIWGSTTSPEFVLTDSTPASLLSVDGRVDKNEFNQSSFNSTDLHAKTNAKAQNQLWSAGIAQQTDYDTTRTSEISGFGLTTADVRHLGLSETPQVTFTPTAVDALSLQGNVTTSHYENNIYTDYRIYSVTPGYSRRVNETNTAILSMQAQRYQTTTNVKTKVDTIGPSAGWSAILSPRFSANASIGAQTSRESLPGLQTPWTWQYTFTAGAAFQGRQDTINLNAVRAQFPYGDGTEALQTTYTFTEAHNLNAHFTLNLGGNYLTATYPISSGGTVKSQLGGNGGMTYHATETVDLTGNYSYAYETLIASTATAHDNTVTLNLSYHPKVWTLLQ